MQLEAAFEVARFIFVDYVLLGKLIEHSRNLGHQRLGRFLVGSVAEGFYGVTGRFVVIPVLQPAGLRLTNPFFS